MRVRGVRGTRSRCSQVARALGRGRARESSRDSARRKGRRNRSSGIKKSERVRAARRWLQLVPSSLLQPTVCTAGTRMDSAVQSQAVTGQTARIPARIALLCTCAQAADGTQTCESPLRQREDAARSPHAPHADPQSVHALILYSPPTRTCETASRPHGARCWIAARRQLIPACRSLAPPPRPGVQSQHQPFPASAGACLGASTRARANRQKCTAPISARPHWAARDSRPPPPAGAGSSTAIRVLLDPGRCPQRRSQDTAHTMATHRHHRPWAAMGPAKLVLQANCSALSLLLAACSCELVLLRP